MLKNMVHLSSHTLIKTRKYYTSETLKMVDLPELVSGSNDMHY